KSCATLMASTIVRSELMRGTQGSDVPVVRIAESSASSTAILYARRSRTPDGPASTLHMARVSRPACDSRCYRLPPHKPLPSREAQREAAQASSARFQGRVERAPLEVTLPLKEVTN